MADSPDDGLDPEDIRNTQPANAVPFVAALLGFAIVAALAFFLLREDRSLRTLRPDDVGVLDDDVVEASGLLPECRAIERAQVDRDEDTVFIELVSRPVDGCECGDACVEEPYRVEIELLEPVGDRRVVAGVGRVELPCDTGGTCGLGR